MRLDAVLDEDRVAHSVVGYVVLHTEVVDTVDRHSSVESVMDSSNVSSSVAL